MEADDENETTKCISRPVYWQPIYLMHVTYYMNLDRPFYMQPEPRMVLESSGLRLWSCG